MKKHSTQSHPGKTGIQFFVLAILLPLLFASCEPAGPAEPPQNDDLIFYDKNSKTLVTYQIFVFDGKQETNLTKDPAHNYWWVRVSPDKTKFLCYRTPRMGDQQTDNPGAGVYENAELMVFNLDGSNPKVIIPKGKHGWSAQGVAKWSPDGQKLLMAAYCKDPQRGFDNLQWRMVVADTDGENPKIVSTKNKIYADPAWSADGNRFVYVSPPDDKPNGGNDDFEIFVADFNWAKSEIEIETRLTNDDLYCFDPTWSPDGQFVAFTTCKFLNTPFNSEIVRLRPDGSDKKILLDDNLSNGVPVWTCDSKRVYFHTLGIGTSYSIASCDAILGGDKKIHLRGGGDDAVLYTTPFPVCQ